MDQRHNYHIATLCGVFLSIHFMNVRQNIGYVLRADCDLQDPGLSRWDRQNLHENTLTTNHYREMECMNEPRSRGAYEKTQSELDATSNIGFRRYPPYDAFTERKNGNEANRISTGLIRLHPVQL